MTIFRKGGLAVLAVLIGLVAAGGALAACLDYRADSFASSYETIPHVEQKGKETVNGKVTKDEPQFRHRVWVGKTDYLVVQMTSRFEPLIVVTRPGDSTVLTQSWLLEARDGYQFAELHFGGGKAHRSNDGWVDVVFRGRETDVEGQFRGWVVSVVAKQKPDGCDSRYIAFQGGEVCNSCSGSSSMPARPDCGGTLCKADECCLLTFGVVGECLRQPADGAGMCQ